MSYIVKRKKLIVDKLGIKYYCANSIIRIGSLRRGLRDLIVFYFR